MSATALAPLIIAGVYLVISFILNLKPRVASAMALGLLLAGAIALTAGKTAVAAELATYSYCFLGAGLLLTVLSRIWRHDNRESENEKTDA